MKQLRHKKILEIISENEIIFDEYVSLGWDVTVMDTSFHPIIDRNTNKVFDETAPIHIGNHNWFGTKCTVLKGVITPPNVSLVTVLY